MASFDEVRFRRQVDTALIKVRQILDRTRHPVYAADVSHCYQDKFWVTEFLVKAALASNLNALSDIGVSEDIIRKLIHWSRSRTVSLRFGCEETCTFDHQATRDEDSAKKSETRVKSGGLESIFSAKVVTTFTEYIWKFEGSYEIIAYCGVGNGSEEQQIILSRTYKHELVTLVRSNPRFEHKRYDNLEVDITEFLTRANSEDLQVAFAIDRKSAACRTPRRNPEVDKVLESFRKLYFWSQKVSQHIRDNLFPVWADHNLDLSAINTKGVFVPVLPLLEDTKWNQSQLKEGLAADVTNVGAGAMTSATDVEPVTLRPTDMAAFLAEEQKTLAQRRADVAKSLPPAETDKLISAAEGQLLVCLAHMGNVAEHLADGLEYVEDMLRKQLTAAVGRVVGPADFAAYMRFHNRRLFLAEFEPRPFCYAVRRSAQHSPEGHVTIEETPPGGGMSEPAYTVVRSVTAQAGRTMEFALNAATTVRFGGERHLHAWMRHSFAGRAGSGGVLLGAQARQFSSFIVLVGTIESARVFDAKYGVIVQNKDDLRIPLVLETLPSPKEFRDAIESLSPEQQAFARALRSMQLASTLFAVCVIQIKPQLERLLNLPAESLTKEIKLTQDLTELFIKYQIPADLLTCGPIAGGGGGGGEPAPGAAAAAPADKVAEVKRHVQAMQELIEGAKKRQLEEQAQQAAYAVMGQATADLPPSSRSAGSSEESELGRRLEGCMPRDDEAVCTGVGDRSEGFAGGGVVKAAEGRPLRRSAGFPASDLRIRGPAPAKPVALSADGGGERPAAAGGDGIAAQGGGDSAARKAAAGRVEDSDVEDYTALPGVLDRKFEALDVDSAVRPTTIRPGEAWTKRSVTSLLSGAADTATLGAEGQREERERAFELLDALTRGGALGLEECSLHVVLAATHGFDKGLVDTVVEDGVNPIDKAERSSLIMASGVVGRPAAELVKPEQLPRLQGLNPALCIQAPPGGL